MAQKSTNKTDERDAVRRSGLVPFVYFEAGKVLLVTSQVVSLHSLAVLLEDQKRKYAKYAA